MASKSKRTSRAAGALAGLEGRLEELRRRFSSARPFRHLVIDGFLEPSLCAELSQGFRGDRRGYDDRPQLDSGRDAAISSLGPAFREVEKLFGGARFWKALRAITGLPALIYEPAAAALTAMPHGRGVPLHLDATRHPSKGWRRELNVFLYLNEGWRPEWGGALELRADPAKAGPEDKLIVPLLNRLVLFEGGGWHGIGRVRLPEGRRGLSRRALGFVYYVDAPGGPVPRPVIHRHPTLPARFEPGYRLSEDDVEELRDLIDWRDRELRRLHELRERAVLETATEAIKKRRS